MQCGWVFLLGSSTNCTIPVLKVFFVHILITEMRFEGIKNHFQDLGKKTTNGISADHCSASNTKCRGRRVEFFMSR